MLLALCLGLATAGCEEKVEAFFAPGAADGSPTVPSLTDVVGPTTTSYDPDPDATTCTPVPDPFDVDATIEDTGDMLDGLPLISVVFPDAPPGGEVTGPYDPSTGDFEGETEEVDQDGGLTAVERWSVEFVGQGDESDYRGSYSGTSEVTFTDTETGGSCEIVYDVSGTLGGA
ncbi:MAG: hypothetical protein ACOC83_06685 [Gemmatimonadota bacterium]